MIGLANGQPVRATDGIVYMATMRCVLKREWRWSKVGPSHVVECTRGTRAGVRQRYAVVWILCMHSDCASFGNLVS